MQCDQCGARRPRTGPCPQCGAPPPGTFSSMRQWRDAGEAPRGGRGSGAGWGGAEDWDDAPGRSSRRGRRGADYQEVDLERALVPAQESLAPMMAGAGLPALPGVPATEEEERAMGIRRPVYIPATNEKKVRPGSFRIVSGVLSLLLLCVASCGVAGFLGRSRIESFIGGPVKTHLTPPTVDYSQVPAKPTSVPGPAAKYLKSAVTSKAVDNGYNATSPTTKFMMNSTVYVVLQVRGLPKGQPHTLSVRWYLGGQDIGVQALAGAQTSWPIKGDSNAYFGLVYPGAGVGQARIYWDRPASDTSNDPKDQYLAQTVTFGVYAPTPTPTPTSKPAGSPSASPSKTPTKSPSASPTKSASGGPAPVAAIKPQTSA